MMTKQCKIDKELEAAAKAKAQKSYLPHVRDGMHVCPVCGQRYYTPENAKCCHGVGGHALRGRRQAPGEPAPESPRMTEAYERVVTNIRTGTVTAADFNNLIEALDKSVRERVARHLRVPKVGPKGVSMAGRVVPKRKGVNDPPHQHRGRRYAAGTAAKKRQNKEQAKAHQSKEEATLRDDLLEQALRRIALSESQIKVVERIIKDEQWVCPHCDQVIVERTVLYHDGKNWYHRPCRDKGPVRLPPTDWSKIDPKWREVLKQET